MNHQPGIGIGIGLAVSVEHDTVLFSSFLFSPASLALAGAGAELGNNV